MQNRSCNINLWLQSAESVYPNFVYVLFLYVTLEVGSVGLFIILNVLMRAITGALET